MKIILIFFIIILGQSISCNFYAQDEIKCIQSVNLKCRFNIQSKNCEDVTTTNLGCNNKLNIMACITQLSDSNDQEAKCYFNNFCKNIQNEQLNQIGCSKNLNLNACVNVTNQFCIWDNSCQDQIVKYNSQKCEEIFGVPVSPKLCAQIQNLECISGGFQYQYECQSINRKLLPQISCSALGLTEKACISITKIGESCIFKDNQCQYINNNITKCELPLNKTACLNIQTPNVMCQWQNNQCSTFTDQTIKCSQLNNVNVNVCASSNEICYYYQEQYKCLSKSKTDINALSNCNIPGLSQEGCINLKNNYCVFKNGQCQQMNELNLQQYQCKMAINEDACLNISTELQFCLWDGEQCREIFINQDLDCTSMFTNSSIKVNGKVCQFIIQNGINCKYNLQTNQCIEATQYDECDAPFLNYNGCVSIIKPMVACQWINQKCQSLIIKHFITTCQSLISVNPIACTLIFENKQYGCYYDFNNHKCNSMKISTNSSYLNTILCTKQGINKVICASITTEGQACSWNLNQYTCNQIQDRNQIKNIPCNQLQYANQRVCQLVTYNGEICRYSNSELSCINSVKSGGHNCSTAGLNQVACSIANGNCFYETTDFVCKSMESIGSDLTKILNSLECEASSPSKAVCKMITTTNQLCSWNSRLNACMTILVLYNQKCVYYSGNSVSVNANVCASIESNFPLTGQTINVNDWVCKYNSKTSTCQVNLNPCSTPCCTEDEKLGTNAHSCSKYSSQEEYVYCYFSSIILRCTQITATQIDIYSTSEVQKYLNQMKLKCSQVSKNGCGLLNWSLQIKCYWNGVLCIDVNYNNFPDLQVFINEPAITNYATCKGIQAMDDDLNPKYFFYNGTRCELIEPKTYNSCEEVYGNRNTCLRHTTNLLCKWDSINLICITITSDEFQEINTCNYNQNILACVSNNNQACYFSYYKDMCLDSPTDIQCNYFDTNGPVNKKGCQKITKDGQICMFNSTINTLQDYKCLSLNVQLSNCDVLGSNAIACYGNTTGNCRWDSINSICYENNNPISTLKCSNNLNKTLCLQITLEPCIWNAVSLKCSKLISFQFDSSSINQKDFNELGCVQIVGISMQYNTQNQTCQKLTTENEQCQSSYTKNITSCLLNTKGNLCYFDSTETILSNRCKQFTDDQTKCQSNTQISIDVCMQILKTCKFDSSTLQCVQVEITKTTTCSSLGNEHYNYLSCASISGDLTDVYNESTCYNREEEAQKCKFEKYCKWNNYTCVIQQLYKNQWNQKYKYNCSTDDSDCSGKKTCCDEDESYTSDTNSGQCTSSNTGTGEYNCNCNCSNLSNLSLDCYDDELCIQTTYHECDYDEKTDIQLMQGCSKYYSIALCLMANDFTTRCIFDLQLGGCLPLVGNEHRIYSCDALYSTSYVNNCNRSYTLNAVCQKSQIERKECDTLQFTNFKCVQTPMPESPYKCSEISNYFGQNASGYICSQATDNCRLSNTSDDTLNCTTSKQCQCNKSYSKSLCEYCKCNFTYTGYCQEDPLPPQINSTQSNKYTLCHEVNLLNVTHKAILCVSVAQACSYISSCEDATGYTCQELAGMQVSQMACIKCQGYSAKYDSTTFLCKQITTIVDICSNINKQACLLSTNKCQWKNNTCNTISKNSNDTDCKSFSQGYCYQVDNVCWINPSTSYCEQFDPSQATCNQLNQKTICILSNKESCYWNEQQSSCQTAPSVYSCEIANQYGCLNMPNQLCGWSSTDYKCQTISFFGSNSSCKPPLWISYSSITNYNSYVCSMLTVKKICFRDETYICRSPNENDTINCNLQGLNQYGCLNSNNQCQYLNQTCITQTNTNLGCLNTLSKYACLSQNSICQFSTLCESFIVTQAIINNSKYYPYTYLTCSALDSTTDQCYYYDYTQNKCINCSTKTAFIKSCTQNGINRIACLQKTTTSCRYINQQCTNITSQQIIQIAICDPTLNWYSCIQLNCKFMNGICQPLINTDNSCLNLANQKSQVNASICASIVDGYPCRLNTSTSICEVTYINQLCTSSGLNVIGCLYYTDGSNCIFKNNKCSNSDKYKLCSEFMNKGQCYSILTKNQFCIWSIAFSVCSNIDRTIFDLSKCLGLRIEGYLQQTNPLTCSLSQDIACFYDQETRTCSEYNSNSVLNNLSRNLPSFNKLACQQYNSQLIGTYWDSQTCQQMTDSQLNEFACTQPLNQYACINIATIYQYCYYDQQKHQCTYTDPDTFKNKTCQSISGINSPRFCEVNQSSVPCKYNKDLHLCETTTIIDDNTTQNQIDQQGYNEAACKCKNCIFQNQCLIKEGQQLLVCTDALQENCQQVSNQGCKISNNVCTAMNSSDYSNFQCSLAINSYACKNIINSTQYCIMYEQQCQYMNPYQSIELLTCQIDAFTNSYQICEQAQDIECSYDFTNKQCSQPSTIFDSCSRGLNNLACFNLTDPTLKCDFLSYCYGPNSSLSTCINDENSCCHQASTLETCLFQSLFKCQWNGQNCQQYTQISQKCDEIFNASRQVCNNIQIDHKLCILDVKNNKCQMIDANSCDLAQSQEQCITIKSIPCIWSYKTKQCSYKEQSELDKCSDVDQIGNERACLNIIKQGYKCIFINGRCNSYQQISDQETCFNNVNKDGCLYQSTTACYWQLNIMQIKKNKYSEYINEIQGICQQFLYYDQYYCNENLSLKSCLLINNPNSQCIWQNNICQQILFDDQSKFTIDSFPLVNSNACSLINNQDMIQYDELTQTCIKVIDSNNLTCYPLIKGLNKLACLSILNQNCVWNNLNLQCEYKGQ